MSFAIIGVSVAKCIYNNIIGTCCIVAQINLQMTLERERERERERKRERERERESDKGQFHSSLRSHVLVTD